MRIGYCAGVANTQTDDSSSPSIEKGKELGFDYVELSLAQLAGLQDTEFSALKERLEASGLKCEACNGFLPASIRVTGPDVDHEKIRDYLSKALDRAAQLGVEIIVFGSSASKNVPEGFPREKAWSQLVELLRLIDPLVKAKGITIAIEPLCSRESNFITTAAEGLKLVKETGRENIRLLIDYYHLVMENENPEIILEAAPFLAHIHFADPMDRGYLREVRDEFITFMNLLKQAGYEGRVSMEAACRDFSREGRRSAELLKQLAR